jgi:hypothetical protein
MASRHIGSVYIRVVPDTKDFRRQTQAAFDRMEPFTVPVEVEVDQAETRRKLDSALDDAQRKSKPHRVDVTPDMDGFEDEVDEGIERATRGKEFTVKVTSDVDGVLDALGTMERELAALERTREISFDLNADDIDEQMERLYDELETGVRSDGVPLRAQLKFRPDEQGYREALRRIEEIQRVAERPIDMPLRLDRPDDIEALRESLEEALEEVTANREPEMIPMSVGLDYDSLQSAIDEVDRHLEALDRVDIEVAMEEGSLEELRDDLVELQQYSQMRVTYTHDEAGYRSVIQRIDELLDDNTVTVDFDTDEESLRQVRDSMERALSWEPVMVTYTDDQQGRRSMIERIRQELNREVLEKEINLNVSRGELLRQLRELEAETPDLMLEVDVTSRSSIDEQIKELENRLRRAQGETVEIPVDLDQSGIETALADLQARRRNVDLHPRVNPFALGMAEGQLAVAARDRWVNLRPRITRSALRDIGGAFAAIAGLNSIRTLVDQIRLITLSFDEWAFQIGTVSAALSTLVSVGTTGLGAVLSVAADTLQVFQGLAMAPTLLLSGATALQTWQAIWNDFGDAISGDTDALERIPENGQAAVAAIQDLDSAVNRTVQNNFWGQMTDEVERFTNAIGPHIVQAMGNTADVMGRTISGMLDYMQQLGDGGALARFTANHSQAMSILGDAAERVFRALMNMGIYGSRYLPVLAEYVDDLAARFESFMNDAISSGQLDLWISNAVDSLQSLGQAAAATWDIFAGLTRAFEDIGGPGLHEMADGLEYISDWVNSSGTQQALRDMFRDAVDGAKAAGEGFADLVETAWDYRDALGDVLVVTGELAGAFMSSLGAINFDVAFRGFFDLMDGLEDFVVRAQPAFESISNIFGRLGSIGGEVAREVAHGLNLTMAAIDGFIARIEGPLIDAIHPLTRVFEDIAALGTGPLHAMADSLAVILELFNALPTPIQNVITLLAVLGRTGILTGFQRGMQNLTRGLSTTQQSVFRFTSNVENRTTRMRDRVSNTMSRMGTSIRRAFTGGNVVGQVNQVAGRVESRFDRMRTRVTTTMGRIRGAVSRGFGGLAGALGGPWGIALTTAIGTLSAFAGASAETEAAQQRLRDTVNDTTGAIEEQAAVEAYDQLSGKADSWWDKVRRVGIDTEEVFSRMGTSAGELAQMMDGPTDEVLEFSDAMQELSDLKPWELEGLKVGSFDDISDGALEVYENMNMASLSNREFYEITGLIAGAFGPVADKVRYTQERTDDLGRSGEDAADSFDQVAAAADGLAPNIESTVQAMEVLADTTSSAEQRVEALDRAMRVMNGEGLSLEDQIIEATDSFHSGMDEIKRIAEQDGFDISQAFTESGDWDVGTRIGAEVMPSVQRMRSGILGEIDILRQEFDEGLIGEGEYTQGLEELETKYNDSLRQIASDLGMTSSETEAFLAYMEEYNAVTFDPKELDILYDPEPARQAEEDWETLDELGLGIDQSEYTASLDADGDGFITEQERVTGMGKAFDELLFEAGLSGDKEEYQNVMDAAVAEGYMFNGKNFVAVLDADGQPTEEGLRLALERGYVWDGEKFVAEADLETGGATDKLVESINNAQGVWDGEEFIAKLGADGEPTEEMLEYAESLGLAWNGEEFVAVVDAEGDGAIEEVTAAREEAMRFEGVYEALLEAGVPASDADDIADAIASVEDFEGNYEALLEAMQTDEGKEAVEDALNNLDEIPDEVRSDIVAFLTGDEDLEWLQERLEELDGTEANTKVDADTDDADEKIDNTTSSVNNLGLLNPLISLGIMGDNHVINQAGEVEGAVGKVDGNFISTLLSTGGPAVVTAALSAFDADSLVDDSFLSTLLTSGSPSVVTAAMAAFGADKLVDDSFLSTLLSTGSGGVIAAAIAAFSASDTVDDIFTAIFGETGANHVQNQAGNVQGSISGINMNPIVTFGATILASFWGTIIRVKNAISGVWSSLTGGGSADGSMTGTRYKQQPVTLFTAKAFASGGFENHTAQIAYSKPSTPIRVWAEPETGGEAYIPLSPAKRQRSMGIFEEVGKEFGVFGDGGIAGGVVTESSEARSGGDVYYITVQGDDLSTKDIVNEMTHQRRRRGRR